MGGGREFNFPWYSGNEYAELYRLFEGKGMPAHFDEWEKGAEEICRNMKKLGSDVRRVVFKKDDFLAWGELNGRGVTHADRDDYVEFIAAQVKPD